MSNDLNGRRSQLRNEVLTSLDVRPFIDGSFIDPVSDRTLPVIEPATNAILVEMPLAGSEEVNAAVESAREAFDSGPWPRMHPRERAAYLNRFAALVEEHSEFIGILESADAGRPISGVFSWDVRNVPEVLRYYAGWCDKITGQVLPDVGDVRLCTYREPVGVCLAIMPWNFPLADLGWKIAPALAAGCTIIVKSAERAPLSAQYLAGLAREAEIPPGVINVLMGTGETAGSQLVSDPRIDKISFTGSTATASRIARMSASHLPRLTFELGGKGANVVCADADLRRAADAAMGAMYSVAGQDCGAGSRLLLDAAIADEFLRLLLPAIRDRRLGDPLDSATEQGPQIDRNQVERVSRLVEEAVSDGATVLAGAKRADAGPNFYEPTLLGNVSPDMNAFRTEFFGPVAGVTTFSGLDQAVALTNDSKYGLSAAVWTNDERKAEEFTRRVNVGTVWTNCYGYFDTTAPWGGRRESGYGKELGREGLDAFLETKTVFRRPN